MPFEADIEVPLVLQRIRDIDVVRRQLRVFLANRAIALGWVLKDFCKPFAHRLFTAARWLAPEARRFLVHRTGWRHRHRRIFEFTTDNSHLSRLRLVVSFLIVLAFVVLLDFALRTTAADTQPVLEASATGFESQIPSQRAALSVSKSPMQGFVSETGSLPRAQIAPVPLPMKKPKLVYKDPNGKKANPVTQKRMAQQKSARPKSMR
jgi:hypothetical protein